MITVSEEGTCLVDVYKLKVSTSDWTIVSMFGRGGVDTPEKLAAAGWQLDSIDSYRSTAQHTGFWCNGECNGVLSLPLPRGSTREAIVREREVLEKRLRVDADHHRIRRQRAVQPCV